MKEIRAGDVIETPAGYRVEVLVTRETRSGCVWVEGIGTRYGLTSPIEYASNLLPHLCELINRSCR